MNRPIKDAPRDGSEVMVFWNDRRVNFTNNELAYWDDELERWVNHLGYVIIIDPARFEPKPADLDKDVYVAPSPDKLPCYMVRREDYAATQD